MPCDATLHSGRPSGLLRVLVAFSLILFCVTAQAAQQPTAKRNVPKQSARSSSLRVTEAKELLRENHVPEAKSKIQEELQQNPANAEAYDLLGVISVSEKDYPSALEAFERALQIDPSSTRTRNSIGNVYVAQGKLDLAAQEFRAVLRVAPANRDAHYNLALVLLAQGSPAKAIFHFERVRPANLETKFNLVRAYLQADRIPDGLKSATELSIQNRDNVQLHFTLGVLLASEKQYRAAQLELEKANALQPETFEILYNLGQTSLRVAEYAKAELTLNRALKLKPDSPDTLYQLAQVYADQKRPVDALELLVRAHKLAPQNADVIFLLARVSMTQNYFEDAIPLLQSGLQLSPNRADLRAALGESYFMSGKTEKAIEEFRALVALEPSARSYAFMGLSYRHLGRFDEARKYFQEGLKLDRHNSSCLFNMGYIEERQGNHAAAESFFQNALKSNPDYSEALLELANLRIARKKYEDAADLLRRYVKVSRDPASGYYKLAMVERNLHQSVAAQRDLNVFQTLSKNSSTGPYPYQNLFDYLDNRTTLSARERTQLDLTQLAEQIQKHPDQPQDIYLLAEAYLKLGRVEDARNSIAKLDQLSASDYRTQTGIGVLLARYRLYDEAIRHFRSALDANPDSDDVKFDLADAYFRKGLYSQALEAVAGVSTAGQQDDAYLALLGDIQAHLGDSVRAAAIFRDAIRRNPDNDQYYLLLTLLQLRSNDMHGAAKTLHQGLLRIPSSGKILWGLGLVSVLEGNTPQAAEHFERAVELLPEWAGSYSTLGVFYYQTGQIEKAREVLSRFKGSNAAGSLDVNRIEEVLSRAPAPATSAGEPMPLVARQQLLQLALSLAERTL